MAKIVHSKTICSKQIDQNRNFDVSGPNHTMPAASKCRVA